MIDLCLPGKEYHVQFHPIVPPDPLQSFLSGVEQVREYFYRNMSAAEPVGSLRISKARGRTAFAPTRPGPNTGATAHVSASNVPLIGARAPTPIQVVKARTKQVLTIVPRVCFRSAYAKRTTRQTDLTFGDHFHCSGSYPQAMCQQFQREFSYRSPSGSPVAN
jgi:hypothetical protein